MFIYELQFTLKPGTKPDELLRLFNDVAAPRFRKIPGLTSVTIVKHMSKCGKAGKRMIVKRVVKLRRQNCMQNSEQW